MCPRSSNYSVSALYRCCTVARRGELKCPVKGGSADFCVCRPLCLLRLSLSHSLNRRGWMETRYRLFSFYKSCSQPCCHPQPVSWSRTTFYLITRCKRFTMPIMRMWCATWRERSAAIKRFGPPESGAG